MKTLFTVAVLFSFGVAALAQNQSQSGTSSTSLIKQSESDLLTVLPEGEFLIDEIPVYTPAPGDQASADIAYDGENFLVVWEDPRNSSMDIYAARVNQDGFVLDIGGIAICTESGSQSKPAVSFDGTNYFVVWSESDIYGARVTTDGLVLDPGGILISDAGGDQKAASIAFDGTNYLVVWHDSRGGDYDIYCARVSPAGTVLDTNGIAICTAVQWQEFPELEFDGTNYLVVWQDYRSLPTPRDIYGTRVTTEGVVLEPDGFIISDAPDQQSYPCVAFDGTNYLVAWSDLRIDSYNPDIFGARVSTSGNVLDTLGIPISVDTIYNDQDKPSVAFDGTNYLVIWRDDRFYETIFGTRVATGGNVLDPEGILVCPVSTSPVSQDLYPALSFGGTNFLIAWERSPCEWPLCFDIYAERVNQTAEALDPQGIIVSNDGYDFFEQWDPAAAFDGTNYLVVWEDDRNNEGDIFGAIISPPPANLHSRLIAISTADNWQYYPAVAFGDTSFLTVWQDERFGSDIYCARVSRTGKIFDIEGIEVSSATNDQENPKVEFDGTNFLVVWRDARSGSHDIYAARVTQQGNVLDPDGIAVCTLTGTDYWLDVSFDGTNYLVVWERGDNILGARITHAGLVLDPDGFDICTDQNVQEDPEVAFDGTNYLVVWDDERNGNNDIYGARVTPSGTVLDPNGNAISTASGKQEYASVIFDGTNYIVTWDDYRNNNDTSDVYCAEVSTNGSVVQEIPMITETGNQFYSSLAHGNNRQVLVVYNGWADEIQGLTIEEDRIWGKFIEIPVGVEDKFTTVPSSFSLEQNYPNPFNPTTKIKFAIPSNVKRQTSNVVLKVYDVLGNEIATLVNEEKPPGEYEVEFSGHSGEDRNLTSGVYFYQLRTGSFIQTKKMLLLK